MMAEVLHGPGLRTYERGQSVVFSRTKEAFRGLSNMAGGFGLRVNGVCILASEALYQACRFPHLPDVQRLIIGQVSPMRAKMAGEPYRGDSRRDWDACRVGIMRWCLRVKLMQNFSAFSSLLTETGERPIVEQSGKDEFWGAKPVEPERLMGENVLGRLLMELRAELLQGLWPKAELPPPDLQDFLLYERPIEAIREADAPALPPALHAALPAGPPPLPKTTPRTA